MLPSSCDLAKPSIVTSLIHRIIIPVVPHKAVAEVSRIGNYERLGVVDLQFKEKTVRNQCSSKFLHNFHQFLQ